MDLSFDRLRSANIARLPQYKNRKGELSHRNGVEDWSPAQWFQALVGELGEFANIQKKVKRGDLTENEARGALADELADVQCYLDLLALRLGIDLGVSTALKFNSVSKRVGSDVFLVV